MIERERSTPVVRIWLLGNFSVERKTDEGTWEEVEKSVWEGSYARILLKRLACALDRRATRSALIDDLWSEKSFRLAEKYLNNAASKLRQSLDKDIVQPLGSRALGGYQLREQAFVWTDLEAWDISLEEAERLRLAGADALALLEQAEQYIQRGKLLEGEGGQWCLPMRTRHETAVRHCRLLLAQEYEARQKFLPARDQYERLLELDPLDEDTLCRLLSLLQQQGMSRDLRTRYEQAKLRFEEEGFPLSEATQALAKQLLQASPPSSLVTPTVDFYVPYQPASLLVAQASATSYNIMSGSSSSLPELDMLMKSRRQVLREMLSSACATLTLSSLWLPDTGERLATLSVRSSSLDTEDLDHLTLITQRYGKLSDNLSLDILSGIAGHLATITQLLKVSHPTPTYKRLCSLASQTALLLGKAFSRLRECDLAMEAFLFSLQVARDAHNADVWAAGVGRIALLHIRWGQPQQVLPLLQEAQRQLLHNQRLRLWLFSIEAEIHAMMGNTDFCMRCLDRSKSETLPISLDDDIYATGFYPSRVAGFEGTCLLRLHQPERALLALNEAFTLCEPTMLVHRSALLADRGTIYAQLGDISTSCSHFVEALEIIEQTQSLVELQRIYKGKHELELWKDSSEVKGLDERLFETLTTLTKLKESG
jgi:DNA-binding SARP family transcriptional activator